MKKLKEITFSADERAQIPNFRPITTEQDKLSALLLLKLSEKIDNSDFESVMGCIHIGKCLSTSLFSPRGIKEYPDDEIRLNQAINTWKRIFKSNDGFLGVDSNTMLSCLDKAVEIFIENEDRLGLHISTNA